MLEPRSADVLMPDMQRVGGADRVPEGRGVVRGLRRPVSSHLFPEMSLPCWRRCRTPFLEHMPWFAPLYGQAVALNGKGEAVVSTAPGWGASFDPAAIARLEAAA